MKALRSSLLLVLILAAAGAVAAATAAPVVPAAPQPAVAAAPVPCSPAAADFAGFLAAPAPQPAPAAAPASGFEPPSFGCGLSCIQTCQFEGCTPTCVNNLYCFCHCGP